MPEYISTLNKKGRTVMWVTSCVEIGRVCSAAESPKLRGLKCPRKLGTWLMSALTKHLTRRMNTESDSKGNAGDLLYSFVTPAR